ncbi:hypothetical protein EDD21DRAFT_391781 [Dissophora ornata]|nr:hypothetical protein EDD21DRAFT_391781 [Dissophora ornata]
MLPSVRPLARTAALTTTRLSYAITNRLRYSTGGKRGHAGTKNDPAIPGDPTGFLPGDKITGDTQIGTYPDMPMYNQQWRDGNPSAGYWDQQDRRNFGETVPEEDEVLNIWSPDVGDFTAGYGMKSILAAAAAFLGFGYLLNETRSEPHFTRRSYPGGLLNELGVDSSDEVMVNKRGARVAEE